MYSVHLNSPAILVAISRVQILLFFLDFWILVNFLIFGPKRAREGPQRVQGRILLHLDQVSAQMGPSWAQSGPFCFSISQKPILGPNSSKSNLGPRAIGPRAPSNMGSRAHGGRRPTFRRGVGGRSPPTATRGVWGGGSPPREKWTLELLPIAKSGTLDNSPHTTCAQSTQLALVQHRQHRSPSKRTELGSSNIFQGKSV